MSNKLMGNKRRNQAEKVLKNATKRASRSEAATVVKQLSKNVDPSLRNQYDVIRKDLLKLRSDLAKGYDLAKSAVERKGFVKQLLGVK